MKKGLWISLIVIFLVVVFAILLSKIDVNGINEETSKCVGEKSILYVQLGCHACEKQLDLFGENINQLTVVDCWYEGEKCAGITATPTWVIGGKQYLGLQTIEKLKQLTKCE